MKKTTDTNYREYLQLTIKSNTFNTCQTNLLKISKFSLLVDDNNNIKRVFAIAQRTLLWQPIFLRVIHTILFR